MKGKLLLTTCSILSGVLFNQINAQEYQPISVQSGFNADVIANGIGPSASSTNNDVDGVSYAFISTDFQLTSSSTPLTYGLPANGLINSVVGSTPGLSYQLASYSANNALRLQNPNDAGTITFTTPIAAVSLYMLATGGSGQCTVDVVANFTDGTSQTFSGINIDDWYYGPNYAIQGIGRINIMNDNLESGYGTDPRLYQIPLTMDVANQSKPIQSVTVTKSGAGGIPNIFAFSADAYTSCPAPTNITYTSAMAGATLSWAAPTVIPSSGYDYYYSSSSTPPTATTTPSGNVATGTSVTLNSLATGQTYYFWVRSNCGGTVGLWKMKPFTTGQISSTYTAGDINTMFSSSFPTPTDVTNCPGAMTMTVPAGYKIKSTSVSYTMSTESNGWMSEQRSILVSSNNSMAEAQVTSGSGSTSGTYSYERTNIPIANGLTGDVIFELRAWRMYGGSDCNADYNKVDNNTWKVTLTLEPVGLAVNEVAAGKKEILAYPNPFVDVVNIQNIEKVKRLSVTDLSGITIKTIDNPSATLHLGDLKTGLYILTLTMKDGSVKSTKIIKK
ncbi:Por secretion system C-terminal sorting domain-containing protein [Chryseobacterium soldanellicola]|uniref:Por secretion system C-terminal sorting domain-containing protein n=1 Tax=Chryseobacterium soldanellicola TaxID=311333 RepID=A0A1H0ZY07_9FLAO|nr:T9SS type A sorting domain-containing protein [Chryseobacterium soldanellicola]SDQ32131.1 Por secretion system C-terminal sorting domain-containing protein [Chryseobacterium soldanellicola]